MMIGAEFSAPADWIRAGDAVTTADAYARTHRGFAPILVFVDAAGRFGNDTECVNGPHGRVADYLARDVRAWVISQLGAPTDPRGWSVVGWSMGGTCAVDLAVTHPELFASFEDISGDIGPNTGTPAQTVTSLYGGDRGAWARFDPLTVLAGHPRYPETVGTSPTHALRTSPAHSRHSGAATAERARRRRRLRRQHRLVRARRRPRPRPAAVRRGHPRRHHLHRAHRARAPHLAIGEDVRSVRVEQEEASAAVGQREVRDVDLGAVRAGH